MTPANFDEDYVAARVSERIYDRGEALYEQEAAEEVVRRGDDLYASVWGSEEEPYRIRIRLRDDAEAPIAQALCTCPYGESYDGWCKHLVAVMLRAVRMPASIPERLSLDETLGRLDADQLRAMLRALVDDDPGLVEQIEGMADLV